MKVELVKNEAGHCSGFRLVAETKDDSLTLGSIRNTNFFGQSFRYKGQCSLDRELDSYVSSVNFGNDSFTYPELGVLQSEKSELLNVLNDTLD